MSQLIEKEKGEIMIGVKEYCEEFAVYLVEHINDRMCVRAYNEGGYNQVNIDFYDLLDWAKDNGWI